MALASLEYPVLTPDVAEGSDVFQGERESILALSAGSKMELRPIHAHAVTVPIIANLGNRLLEKSPLHIVRAAQCEAQAGLHLIAITEIGAKLITGELDRRVTPEEVSDIGKDAPSVIRIVLL